MLNSDAPRYSDAIAMRFFETSEGRLHGGRICGLLYIIIVALNCIRVHERTCFGWITFTAGWWLCFGAKQPKRTFREMFHPLGIAGLILVVLGLAGAFYFVRHH